MKNGVNIEFENMDGKIKELQEKIELLERDKENTTNTRQVHTPDNTTQNKLVSKGVSQRDIDGVHVPRDYVNRTIETLGLNFSILAVDILGQTGADQPR